MMQAGNEGSGMSSDLPAAVRQFGRLLRAHLLLSVLRHPWRFVLLVLAVAFMGWLSGYDAR